MSIICSIFVLNSVIIPTLERILPDQCPLINSQELCSLGWILRLYYLLRVGLIQMFYVSTNPNIMFMSYVRSYAGCRKFIYIHQVLSVWPPCGCYSNINWKIFLQIVICSVITDLMTPLDSIYGSYFSYSPLWLLVNILKRATCKR